MNAGLTQHLTGFARRPGASTAEVELELSSSGIELPADYWGLLRFANGCVGSSAMNTCASIQPTSSCRSTTHSAPRSSSQADLSLALMAAERLGPLICK